MLNNNNEILNKWLPTFIVAALLIVFYKTLDKIDVIAEFIGNFINIISPFLLSILISYFLYIPCQKLENFFMKVENIELRFIPKVIPLFLSKRVRLFSVLSIYLLFLSIIVVIIIFIVPILIFSLTDLTRDMPKYYESVIIFINNLPTSKLADLDLKSNLSDLVNKVFAILFDPVKIEKIIRNVFGFANGFFKIFISLIISIYILLDREQILDFVKKLSKILLKNKTIENLKKYLEEINKVVFPFIIGKSFDSLINWFFVTVILLILDVRYAFLFGFIAGIANFIPYLGSLIAVSFIILMTILIGGIDSAVKVSILLIIFQQLDANFIEPRIMRAKLKISPILVIFSVIFGGAYFGILGMFLAVPIAAILKQLLSEYVEPKTNNTNGLEI